MFHGSIVALVTPMDEQGVIDYIGLSNLVDFHLNNQTDGLVVMGTTGESATISVEEQHQVIRHVLKQVKGRIPVIAGTGAAATSKTIELTLQAMALGVDACLIMTPPYIKPTQEGLYQHYRAIAKKAALPIIVYNVPGRTACDIFPDTLERLAELPNIIGVKEATGDPKRARAILDRCGERMDILSGEDGIAKDIILLGGKGVISVTANVAPQLMHDMCKLALEKNVKEADAINDKLTALHKILFIESNPIPVKWALHMMGFISTGIRLPLTPLTLQYHETLRSVLVQVGVLH